MKKIEMDSVDLAGAASQRCQDVHVLLPQITQPTLVMAIQHDPLHVYLDEAASKIRNSEKALIETEAGTAGKLAALQKFYGILA